MRFEGFLEFSTEMKKQLLQKIIDPKLQKYIFFPLDFGFYKQPTDTLKNIDCLVENVVRNKVGSVLMHKGLVKTYQQKLRNSRYPFFLHLTASSGLYPTVEKVQIASVQEAKDLGAIGVSTLIYLGNSHELDMLKMLGKISEEADRLGMLVYTMMYVADFIKGKFVEKLTIDDIQYAARIAYELGVDIVETRLPDDVKDLAIIKEFCPIPLIFGDRSSYLEPGYRQNIKLVMQNGYDGVSISERSLTTLFPKLLKMTREALAS